MPTKIEWCDESINPIRTSTGGWHCVKSTPGCANCYAEDINNRFGDGKPYLKREVEYVLSETALKKPYKWKKPKKIFIQSMSDLFLFGTPADFIFKIIDMINYCPQHIFIILTKYPDNALKFLNDFDIKLPNNVWFGITTENQKTFMARLMYLRRIQAQVKFLSIEPMLSSIELIGNWSQWGCNGKTFNPKTGKHEHYHDEFCRKPFDWIIVGGENCRNARKMHPDWVRYIRDECNRFDVPFFFKGWGEHFPVTSILHDKKGNFDSQGKGLEYFENNELTGLNNDSSSFIVTTPYKNYGIKEDRSPWWFARVGKKVSGDLLDDKQWQQFPVTNGKARADVFVMKWNKIEVKQ